MKRSSVFFSLLFVCLISSGIAFDQADTKPVEKKTCPFDIVGMWKSEAMNDETNPVFFLFQPDGWVRVMGQSADALPEEFEVIAEVRYKLDKATRLKSIEFSTEKGNDAFASGITVMDITEFNEDSFTTADTNLGQKNKWERVQTHRYFVTFAARALSPQSGPAFVMLTTLDGRRTKVEAIGLQVTKDEKGKTEATFGLIPDKLYEEFRWESDKDSDVMMRLELTRTEYARTYRVFETWKELIKEKKLPNEDPYVNAMDFLRKTSDSLNECSEKIKLPQADQPKNSDAASNQNLPQLLLGYVKSLRKKNDERHLANAMFPTGWRPLQAPVKQ